MDGTGECVPERATSKAIVTRFRSGFASERRGWHSDGNRDRDAYDRGGQRRWPRLLRPRRLRLRIPGRRHHGSRGLYKGKPFNPNPRARFEGREHEYHREYGNQNAYQGEYTDGYRAGYRATFDRRY